MAIVMLGLVCGAAIGPFLTAYLWNKLEYGPRVLIMIMGFSSFIPILFLYIIKKNSNDSNTNNSKIELKSLYSSTSNYDNQLSYDSYDVPNNLIKL